SPLSSLGPPQARDGHYRSSAATDQTPVWVTGQALLAVNSKPFPLAPVPRSAVNRPQGGASPGGAASVAKGAGAKTTAPKPGGAASEPPATGTAETPTTATPLDPASSHTGSGSAHALPTCF